MVDVSKLNANVTQGFDNGCAVVVVNAMIEKIKRNGPVHGAGIYISEPKCRSQVAGQGAFTAGRVAVYGNDDVSHEVLVDELSGKNRSYLTFIFAPLPIRASFPRAFRKE